ncbi:MAG: cysteine-rich CWC family protein [Pyrinomonadaceae bacterium]
MTETLQTNLICESCGEEFSCGSKTGNCWCFDVDSESENLSKLRENVKNCFCEKCLEKKAASLPDKTNNVLTNS